MRIRRTIAPVLLIAISAACSAPPTAPAEPVVPIPAPQPNLEPDFADLLTTPKP